MKKETRIKIYTHNDLDGFMCYYILEKAFYGNAKISVYYTQPYKVYNDIFRDDVIDMYSAVYMTDLGISNKEYQELMTEFKNLVFIDHHDNGIDNTKFKNRSYINTSISACLCTFRCVKNLLNKSYTEDELKRLSSILKLVSDYDTGVWMTSGNYFPEKINRAFHILSKSEFMEVIDRYVFDNDLSLLNTYNDLIDSNRKEDIKSIKNINTFETIYNNHKIIVVDSDVVKLNSFQIRKLFDLTGCNIIFIYNKNNDTIKARTRGVNLFELLNKRTKGHATACTFRMDHVPLLNIIIKNSGLSVC